MAHGVPRRRSIQVFVLVALLSALLLLCACSDARCPTCVEGVDPAKLIDPETLGDGSGYPGATWTVAPDPQLLGWSERRLKAVEERARALGSDALLVVDRGVIVLEHGASARNLIVQSCRKSFLSALYGIQVQAGVIDLDSSLADLGVDDLPPSLTPSEKQGTLRHLIMARSGVYHEAAAESQSMKDARPARESHAPGTFWYYNNWDFNVLGTAYRQLAGEDIFQALYDRLALPLQMQDFLPSNGWYFYEAMSEHPAYHFRMSPRDMARFGLLFLRGGRWRDQQVVPETWVGESTHPWSDAGSTWGYGYMWWVGKPDAWGGPAPYSARGGSGQAIYVVPDLGVVVTHKVDNSTWTHGWSEVDDLVRQVMAAKVL